MQKGFHRPPTPEPRPHNLPLPVLLNRRLALLFLTLSNESNKPEQRRQHNENDPDAHISGMIGSQGDSLIRVTRLRATRSKPETAAAG
jgi:hypothetical protein